MINAVNAGNDILLEANYFVEGENLPQKIRNIISKAIKEGKIKESRIDEAFTRILTLKTRINKII